MIKKIIIILTSLLIFGIALTGIAYFVGGEEPQTPSSVLSDKIELDDFKDVVIDVIAADIKIQNGDTFSISYRLHRREKVEQVEVVDGTLYFTTGIHTGIGRSPKPNGEQYSICITVPDQSILNNLNISTVDGDIEFSDREIRSAACNSVSGSIKLTGVTAEQLTCEVVSGKISVTKSDIIEASASGKSSDIVFDGSFENADINTVSGNCDLVSDTIKNIKIENISGDIKAVTPAAGISAKSYGKINYCGEKQGFHFALPDNGAMLTLISTSGKIDIQTNSDD